MSQIALVFKSNSVFFSFFICVCIFNLLSKTIYFTYLLFSRMVCFMQTEEKIPFLRVKLIWKVLVLFVLFFHIFDHHSVRFRWCCKLSYYRLNIINYLKWVKRVASSMNNIKGMCYPNKCTIRDWIELNVFSMNIAYLNFHRKLNKYYIKLNK